MADTQDRSWLGEVNGIVDTKIDEKIDDFRENEFKPAVDGLTRQFGLFMTRLDDINENTRRSAVASERSLDEQKEQREQLRKETKAQQDALRAQMDVLLQATPPAVAAKKKAKREHTIKEIITKASGWLFGAGGLFTIITYLVDKFLLNQ